MEYTEWRKSSYSLPDGNCIEIQGTQVRDSKNQDGVILSFGRETWETFLASLK